MQDEQYLQLKAEIRQLINQEGKLDDRQLRVIIEQRLLAQEWSTLLSTAEKLSRMEQLFHAFRGLDLLHPLLEDQSISEIMINSYDKIFVEQYGVIKQLSLRFESKERLEDLIQTIVSSINREVNESSPIVDARLKDGSRVHVVLPPVALKGPSLTIRKFPETPLAMQDLIDFGSITKEAALFLQQVVVAKYNLFISGGTGTGKTTFLNVLSQFIPSTERVVTIEDSAELKISSLCNVVALETRNANTEGRGAVFIKELIRASLRMRPDRIIVGEVRGEEALDMLQALNTGHEGSMSTGHANSASDMMSRLETMVLGAAELPVSAIRNQIVSALDIIIHLARNRFGKRQVVEISEITGLADGEVQIVPLFSLNQGLNKEGKTDMLTRTAYQLQNMEKWLASEHTAYSGQEGRLYEQKTKSNIG